MENCPFCGSDYLKHFEINDSGVVEHCIECRNCFARGPFAETLNAAEKLWNKIQR